MSARLDIDAARRIIDQEGGDPDDLETWASAVRRARYRREFASLRESEISP